MSHYLRPKVSEARVALKTFTVFEKITGSIGFIKPSRRIIPSDFRDEAERLSIVVTRSFLIKISVKVFLIIQLRRIKTT